MTSDRSYRQGMTHDEAIRILFDCAGTMFDPGIVDVFLKLPFKDAVVPQQSANHLVQAREIVAAEAR